jgi:hypothetical protein
VKGLLQDPGWKDEGIIDLGGIKTARGPENYIVLFFETIGVLKTPFFNIHITYRDDGSGMRMRAMPPERTRLRSAEKRGKRNERLDYCCRPRHRHHH